MRNRKVVCANGNEIRNGHVDGRRTMMWQRKRTHAAARRSQLGKRFLEEGGCRDGSDPDGE